MNRLQRLLTMLCAPLAVLLAISAPASAARKCRERDKDTGECTRWEVPSVNAHIVLQGKPEGAKVSLDGETVCTLPCDVTRKTQVDPLELWLSAPGFESREVPVGSAERWTKTDIHLAACPSIDFSKVPDGSKVSVSGFQVGIWPQDFPDKSPLGAAERVAKALGQRPVGPCKLRPQKLKMRIEQELFAPWEGELMAEMDRTTVAEPVLQPKSGSIVVWSSVGDVELYLDGRPVLLLPATGARDVAIEIANVSAGQHVVALRMPSGTQSDLSGGAALTENQFWGEFDHETLTRVENGQPSYVSFAPRIPAPPLHPAVNPTQYTVNRKQLSELCLSDSSACLALGWAQRWGVGGEVDLPAAADSFATSCTAANRGRGERTHLQACTALTWLQEMGMVAPPEGAHDAYLCAEAGLFPDDPIAPCVRARLSREAQRKVDPTLYVAHDAESSTGGFPVFATAGWGPKQQFVRLGIGTSGSLGPLMFDVWFLGGAGKYERLDDQFRERHTEVRPTLGIEVGPAFRFAPHFYGLAHFTVNAVLYDSDTESNAALYGARLAAGVTMGHSTRHRFFLEPGIMLEGGTPELTNPSKKQLIDRVLKTRDADTFAQNWKRLKNTDAEFFWTICLNAGWVLGN